MRKSLWIILTVLFVAVWATPAHANTLYTYTYNEIYYNYTMSWSTGPIPGVTMATTIPAVDLLGVSVTGTSLVGCSITSAVLDAPANGSGGAGGVTVYLVAPCVGIPTGSGFFQSNYATLTAPADYTVPGTYYDQLSGTLAVAAIPTPEPSSIMLFGTGLLGLLALAARSKRHAPPTSC